MKPLLMAELIKLRTTRTFIALTGAAVGTSLLHHDPVGGPDRAGTEHDVLRDVFNSDTSGLFILILAVIGITGEWRHQHDHELAARRARPDPVPRGEDDRVRGRRPRAVGADLDRDRDRRATRS